MYDRYQCGCQCIHSVGWNGGRIIRQTSLYEFVVVCPKGYLTLIEYNFDVHDVRSILSTKTTNYAALAQLEERPGSNLWCGEGRFRFESWRLHQKYFRISQKGLYSPSWDNPILLNAQSANTNPRKSPWAWDFYLAQWKTFSIRSPVTIKNKFNSSSIKTKFTRITPGATLCISAPSATHLTIKSTSLSTIKTVNYFFKRSRIAKPARNHESICPRTTTRNSSLIYVAPNATTTLFNSR